MLERLVEKALRVDAPEKLLADVEEALAIAESSNLDVDFWKVQDSYYATLQELLQQPIVHRSEDWLKGFLCLGNNLRVLVSDDQRGSLVSKLAR